jgi:hypothetical protein
MDDEIDFDEIEYEVFETPDHEDDQDEDHPVERELLRFKSLILLAIFILPTLIIVIEVLTGRISGVISPSNSEPLITPEQLPSVHF